MTPTETKPPLKPRQRFGKYRIVRRLATGGFADVYEALDTIEGIRVALKVPLPKMLGPDRIADFKREVRLTAGLNHPHILSIKNADVIEGLFTIAYALGECSLGDRMQWRMTTRTAIRFIGQMVDALAYAHRHHIIHCDIKPENIILFPGGNACLTDFGIAKIAMRTRDASNSGTLGYLAPEQAMGRPSKSSDVFSLALVIWQMLTHELPRWPFEWPPPGHQALRRRLPPEGIDILWRALDIDSNRRFRDASQMLRAYQKMIDNISASPRRRKRWL